MKTKTLEALYQEVLASEELKKEFAQAAQDEKRLESWIRAQGCDATLEQVQAFLKEKQEKTGELADDELAAAAGGGCSGGEAAASIFTVGLACAVTAMVSAANGASGSDPDESGVLCHCWRF